MTTRIIATGAYAPGQVITNNDLAKILIQVMSGLHSVQELKKDIYHQVITHLCSQ